MTKREYKRKMREQRIYGLILLAVIVVLCVLYATAPETEKDFTGVIVVSPMAFTYLFSKKLWIV